MNIIELKKINKFFGSGANRVHVLKDIDLSIGIDMAHDNGVGFNLLAKFYQMSVQLFPAPKIHMAEPEHAAQISVRIINDIMPDTRQTVRNFAAHRILGRPDGFKHIKIGNVQYFSHFEILLSVC